MENLFSFKTFLSHKYDSAEINLYFFQIFNKLADVQFEIDAGKTPTNVTRLERMIREADAFIGIYPFTGTPEEAQKPEQLKKQSQYFRLELDLAIRSQKPAIVFYDKRYGSLLVPPGTIFSHAYDFREITGTGGFPSLNKHTIAVERFCEAVQKSKNYTDLVDKTDRNTIAIIHSCDENSNQHYSSNCIDKIKDILYSHNYSDIEIIQGPPRLDNKLFRLIEKIDFAIIDHEGSITATGLPAYLHGRFIPMIRLRHIKDNASPEDEALDEFLFSGVEVGYKKNLIKWQEEQSLLDELSIKLDIINSNIIRINDAEEARKYFIRATLRKEAVFVSYSGKDIDIAKNIIASLKKHYQVVFDYRDGKSIVPGQPWLKEIFDKLATSAIGINLFSQSYIQSGNCMHEAQQMVANLDAGTIKLFPVKLGEEPLDLPPFFGMTQYFRAVDYANTDELVKEIVNISSAK